MYNTVPDTTNVNPIFSSYNVRSANFNENMDEFVKADNELYIEEQKKKKPEEKRSLNSDAINGIPNMPEFLKEEHNEIYKMPEWLEKLNVCSPDEIEEWKKQGGMGIAEAWRKNHQWASFAPYVNTTRDAADAITVSVLLDRAKKGEELTYEQQEKLVDYLRDMKELQVRGFTFGGGTVNAILATIPYVEEFAIGIGTSEGGVGLASLAKTLSTIGAKKAARKAVQAALKEAAIKSAAPAAAKKTLSLSAAKKIYKDTVAKTTMSKALVNLGAKEALKETGKALPAAIGTSAKFGLTKMPHTFMGGIADKQIATGVYVTDLGDAVFTDSEHLATSIMKSFGESTFEALTETAGWTLSPVAGYFAKPLQKALPKKFFTGFEKLVSSRYGMPAADALRKYGYDGVIEEMGEEVLNRFLCQTFGINGLDEYNFDGFMNNVLYADNPSQWGQEALSFAAVGAGGHIVAGSGSRITDEWNKRQYKKNVAALTERANRYIQSPEQFYLDQGLIKIKGSQSLAEQKLRDIWTAQNVDEGLQNDVLKNMSETEIRSELKKAIEDETKDFTPEVATERIEKDLTQKFIDNKTFAREKDAKSVAALFATPLQKLSEVTGLSLEEVMEEEMPVIQREAEIAQRENGRYIQTDGRIEELFKELDNLPSDFNDENYINQLIEEIDILSKIRDGNLEESEYDKAKSLINALETAEYTELANELREIHYNQTGQLFQADKSEDNLIEHFGMSSSELTDMVKADIENILTEYDVTEDEFKLEDIRVYGSYTTGKNKDTSDLDFIVQYSGSMREDDAFNMLHDEGLSIEDKDGREVVIDINPVNPEMSGTIEDHTGQRYFQAAYHGTPHDFEAFSTNNIGSGEGAQAHGWGLYFAENRDVSDRYRTKLVSRSMNGFNEYTFSINGEPIDEDLNFFLSNNLSGGVLYNAANTDNEESQKELIDSVKWHIDYLRRGDASTVRLIKMLQEAIDKIEDNPKISIAKFLDEVPEYEKYRFKTLANVAKREAKEEGKKANIQYLLKWIKEQQKPFVEERNKQLATLEKLEKLDIDNIKISRRTGQLFEVDIPEDEVLLDEQKTLADQSETVKKVVFQLLNEIHGKHEMLTDAEVLQKRLYKKYEDRSIRAAIDVLLFDGIERDELYNMSFEDLHSLDAFLFKGRDFYKLLSKNLGSDKLASEKLNELGIKGITYNGLQDGRCYVVFDENSVEVIQKYYQGAKSNYQEQLEEAKANIEFKKFVNKIYNNKLPKKEQSNLFTIGRTPAKLVEAGIPQDNLAIGVKVINKARKNKNPDHNLSEETISKVYTALKNPIAVIETLPDAKEIDKNKKYAVVLDLKADNGDYVMASIKINQDNKGAIVNEIKTIHSRENYEPLIDKALNDGKLIKVDREKIKDLLNSKIHSELISDGAASLIDKIYQENNNVKYYQEEPVQGNMFYDNEKARGIQKVKGAFVPAENLIELFKNADESTIIHEFAHWWLSRLEKYAQYNDELALDLAEVRKFVKNDGGKFTREQHEKFAVGFEAYIRNGSARSNRLKKIFEDFKNALIQIYDSIKQLVYTEDGTQYSFSEADVENLNNLFERLLTTENERIRKTVFDRCDDINDRIKEIKAHQEEEMKELDELWRDNIAINNRKSDKRRKVQEYLEMAETASRKLPKEVKEMQKRYKDVTLSILEVATGMKKNVIANPRNWEKVQEAFEGTDRITASDGFHPEWAEFYSDTGVSYDNDEIDGDNKLAQQAFDVMVDGTYQFANMDEDEISEFYGKFDYLYNKIKTLKGEEKQNAWEALVSLFDNMPSMPDEVVTDLAQKLSDSYETYEEGQKEDFNRKHYPSIPVVQQLQFYVTNKLNELKVYDPNVKYKVRLSKSHSLYKAIKNATSVNSTKRIVRMINDYVISDLENQAKAILHKEIQKQIKVNSKLVKIGTLKKGKFDWKTNSVFAELAELNKLKQKEALKEYGAMIELDKVAAGEERDDNDENPVATPEFKTDFQSNLRRKFLEYRSNKLKDLNLLATRSLLEDIMTLKFEGRRAKDAEELEKQLQKDNMKTDLAYRVRLIKDNKAAQAVAKFIMGETPLTSERTLANWETSLNAIFGKEVAQRYSLLKLESDAEVYAYKHYSEFCQKAMDIYGLNNPINAKEKFVDKFNRFVDYGNIQPLVKLMQEYEEEVYNFKETTFSKETGQYIETGTLLSRAEIITLYAWSMNEELEQRITTQFGVYQTQYMFNEVLSDEDKQFAWLLIDTCEAMYDENNEVFIRTMGLSLPKVQNYFPSKTVRVGSEIDMLHENVVRSSNPSFIKQRKTCNRIKMKPEQPISILLPHINKTARYVILSERLNYLNAIFKDATVRAAIKEVFDGVEMPYALSGEKVKGKKSKQKRTVGDRIHDTLLNQLGSSTFENYVRGLNVGKTWADALAANYITSRIGGNAKVMFGQLTSVINYAEKMPLGLWSKGFAEAIKKPKETFKYMMDNCDYLKARLAGNSMNEIMSRITDETDRFRSLRNFCATNTKYGDILAICFGGKPYIDYLVSQGMNEGEAFDKFVEDTLRAQQSGHNSATSVWQKKMSENFFTRMMFAFNNTSLQYERKFLDAIAARTRGDIGNKELIKAVLLYKVFNPIIFTSFLGNLSLMQLIGALLRGDDDEDALARFGIDAASAMVFSNMGAYGFAGMGISTLMQFLKTLIDKKEYKPFLKTVPIIGDIEEIGKEIILKDEVTFADWVDAMSLIGDDATGVPVSRLTNTAGGVGDMAQGEYGVGALRMLGYGNYRANVAATGHPPEKKKRKNKK